MSELNVNLKDSAGVAHYGFNAAAVGALFSGITQLEEGKKEVAKRMAAGMRILKVPDMLIQDSEYRNKIKEALENMESSNGVMILSMTKDSEFTLSVDPAWAPDITSIDTRCGACGTKPDNWHAFCIECGIKL